LRYLLFGEVEMNGTSQVTTFNQATSADAIHCLWMQAGVVDYKLCDREYDCDQCPFDEAIHSRPSKHGSFSLSRDHVDAAMMKMRTAHSMAVQGCEVAQSLFYHSGHTWARVEAGGVVRVGLDDFGQRVLGPAYSIELPSAHATMKRGEVCWRLTHQCGVTHLVSPVSGKVLSVNSNLLLRPSLVNRDPYAEGWTILIEPSDLKGCLKRLMYGERVRQWLAQEIEKLRLLVNGTSKQDTKISTTMTDGGLLRQEFLSGLTIEEMRRVISSFFPFPLAGEPERNHAILLQNGR